MPLGEETRTLEEEFSEGHWGELPGLSRRIAALWREHLYPPVVVGSAPGPDAVLLASNDYLALASDSRIVQAQAESLMSSGAELFMSGVYAQYLDQQRQLEREVADFMGTEDAVLCQSGYLANEGLIQVLADPQTPVYLDMEAHMSLWQGAQAAGAPAHPFRHNNVGHLRSLVGKYGPGVVAVDAVFSISGGLCPLEDILDVCESSGCILVADESHAVGVFGEEGEGLVRARGLHDRVHYRTFSWSKALVGRAGMIMGPARVMEFFRADSRPAIFSSCVLPWEVARFAKTLEVVRAEGERRRQVWEKADHLRRGLTDAGYDVSSSESPIMSIEPGPEENTKLFRDTLEARGVFGAVFSGPATPKNRCTVRFCVNHSLTREQLDGVIGVCRDIRDEVGCEDWASTRRARRRQPPSQLVSSVAAGE